MQLLSTTVQTQVKPILNPRSSLHQKFSTWMGMKYAVCATAEAWGEKKRGSTTKKGSIAEGHNSLVEIKESSTSGFKWGN